jgi:acyl-CoA synthetase (AMP-forming)/AMP-acid ligase II
MTATMHAFGTFVSMGHFDPATALELIEAERVTAMFPAFPPLTLGMLNSPGYSPASFARVRTVFTVAPPERCAPCSAGCRTACWSTPTA